MSSYCLANFILGNIAMEVQLNKQPNLFSAITIGVGSIIGSGWLFASYYAAKYAGPISLDPAIENKEIGI